MMGNKSQEWLRDVVVINENKDVRIAGDVELYRSAGDLGRKIEPWYINDVEFLALNGLGQTLVLKTYGSEISISIDSSIEPDAALLLALLQAAAQGMRDARIFRSSKRKLTLGPMESKGILPTTVEGLVAYVGFN